MDWVVLHMDWIYGVLLFSLLMLAGAAVSSSKGQPKRTSRL